MKHPFAVRLTGDSAAETAHVLVRRLVEVGSAVCPPDRQPGEAFEGVVVRLEDAASGFSVDETIEVSPHDTPDFAAEKVLDFLGEQGVIALESDAYSPEEEEEIRQRLADLGYID